MRGEVPRVAPPALDACSDVPLYNTKSVVHQTGVPAPTLRAWERRYGILTPSRGGNDYRLYSERDIITVAWLRERVQTGMTISQAIALLKSLQAVKKQAAEPARTPTSGATQTNGHKSAVAAPNPMRYSLAELQTMLLHQLANYDEIASRRTIAQALAVHSVEDVCTGLLSPVLAQIGDLWADGELNVVAEHFASNVVRAHLESIFRSLGEYETGPLVMVGCAPGEQHEIGALMLAVFLRRAGVRAAYLGQNVETTSLLQAIRALLPAVVVLTAVMPESAWTVAQVAELVADLSVPEVIFGFGGPAFMSTPERAETIPGLFLDDDLAQATSTIRARLAG